MRAPPPTSQPAWHGLARLGLAPLVLALMLGLAHACIHHPNLWSKIFDQRETDEYKYIYIYATHPV